MKYSSWLWLIILNAIMILIFFYIQQDIASRISYWYNPRECYPYDGLSCWQPSMSRTFLFYVLSATCTRPTECTTQYIPGTLTFDWSQAVLLIAGAADVVTLVQWLRIRRKLAATKWSMRVCLAFQKIPANPSSTQLTARISIPNKLTDPVRRARNRFYQHSQLSDTKLWCCGWPFIM